MQGCGGLVEVCDKKKLSKGVEWTLWLDTPIHADLQHYPKRREMLFSHSPDRPNLADVLFRALEKLIQTREFR